MALSRTGKHPIALYLELLRHMTSLIVFQRSNMLHSYHSSMVLFSRKSQMSYTKRERLRRCISLVTRPTLIPFTTVTKMISRFKFQCPTLGQFHNQGLRTFINLHIVLMISLNLTPCDWSFQDVLLVGCQNSVMESSFLKIQNCTVTDTWNCEPWQPIHPIYANIFLTNPSKLQVSHAQISHSFGKKDLISSNVLFTHANIPNPVFSSTIRQLVSSVWSKLTKSHGSRMYSVIAKWTSCIKAWVTAKNRTITTNVAIFNTIQIFSLMITTSTRSRSKERMMMVMHLCNHSPKLLWIILGWIMPM